MCSFVGKNKKVPEPQTPESGWVPGTEKWAAKKRLPLVIGESALLIADYFELG